MMQVRKKDVFFYVAMPQILPRIRELFVSGFQYIPYLIALVYSAVRLLPPDHPYLRGENIGRYGLRNVVAAAANNLTWSWKNIDQIIMFAMVLIGLVLMVIQICMLGFALFTNPVFANGNVPGTFAGFFVTQNPQNDLAFMILDMVFGVPNSGDTAFFGSCVSTGTCVETGDIHWGMDPSSYPFPVHHGLHRMFEMYSLGLLVIATMVFIYMIVTILVETMQSGTAFGRRYNHVWAPIRMVVAFGLLIPLAGYNTSQYLVLYAAKFGSGFATNGWLMFNENMRDIVGQDEKYALTPSSGGGYEDLIAVPGVPEFGPFLQFLFSARTCYYGERAREGGDDAAKEIKPYAVRSPGQVHEISDDYAGLMTFLEGDMGVTIRFGSWNGENKNNSIAYNNTVAPICGEIYLPLTDSRPAGDQEPGVRALQELYLGFIRHFWYSMLDYETRQLSYGFVSTHVLFEDEGVPDSSYAVNVRNAVESAVKGALTNPGSHYYTQNYISVPLPENGVIGALAESNRWGITDEMRRMGWAGAAIWYNKIAELNGVLGEAVGNVPRIIHYPVVMEAVAEAKRQGDGQVDPKEQFKYVNEALPDPFDIKLAKAYWASYNYWQTSGVMESTHTRVSGNAIKDVLNLLLGTNGLFNMRSEENINVHPLAQLSAVGRALVSSSIRNLSGATVGAGAGILAGIASQFVGEMAKTLSSSIVTFAMIGLSIGFVLYYIVPFLPFIYFAFAFGGWVKGIFEAMVGAPLWALAHIRIDGHGLPGQAALTGYFLIFEIFLRPILMIFGLIASVSIFAALVYVLNMVFDTVVSNVGGYDVAAAYTEAESVLDGFRDVVDEFFFTVIYVIIVYMIGMSCFKLIDLIPNNILRWMGQAVSTFNDSQENAADSLVGRVSQGSQQTSQAIGGGLSKILG